MKVLDEDKTSEIVATLVRRHRLFKELSEDDQQWIILQPQDAISLMSEAIKSRNGDYALLLEKRLADLQGLLSRMDRCADTWCLDYKNLVKELELSNLPKARLKEICARANAMTRTEMSIYREREKASISKKR